MEADSDSQQADKVGPRPRVQYRLLACGLLLRDAVEQGAVVPLVEHVSV